MGGKVGLFFRSCNRKYEATWWQEMQLSGFFCRSFLKLELRKNERKNLSNHIDFGFQNIFTVARTFQILRLYQIS